MHREIVDELANCVGDAAAAESSEPLPIWYPLWMYANYPTELDGWCEETTRATNWCWVVGYNNNEWGVWAVPKNWEWWPPEY